MRLMKYFMILTIFIFSTSTHGEENFDADPTAKTVMTCGEAAEAGQAEASGLYFQMVDGVLKIRDDSGGIGGSSSIDAKIEISKSEVDHHCVVTLAATDANGQDVLDLEVNLSAKGSSQFTLKNYHFPSAKIAPYAIKRAFVNEELNQHTELKFGNPFPIPCNIKDEEFKKSLSGCK